MEFNEQIEDSYRKKMSDLSGAELCDFNNNNKTTKLCDCNNNKFYDVRDSYNTYYYDKPLMNRPLFMSNTPSDFRSRINKVLKSCVYMRHDLEVIIVDNLF